MARADLPHDDRLDNANKSEYRIWSDACTALLKRGDSLTRPLTEEKIPVNVNVYAEIIKSYFQQPIVDFTNGMNNKRFDQFKIQIWRDGDELPGNGGGVDYPGDLGISRIRVRESLSISNDYGKATHYGNINFYADTSIDDHWITDDLNFNLYTNDAHYEGYYCYVVNPTADIPQGQRFETGLNLKQDKYPVTLVIRQAFLVSGGSKCEVLNKNEDLGIKLADITIDEFTIIGGGSNG